MVKERVRQAVEWVKQGITQPRRELNRWQTAVRFLYDLSVHGWKSLNQDNAPQMAAALAYRSLFALIPILIVGTVIVKAVLGDQLLAMTSTIIDALGLRTFEIHPAEPAAEAGEITVVAVGAWLENIIQQLATLNLQAIGWMGFAILVYAAITMMVTIENSFNTLYRAPQGRPWIRRVTTYWFVLTLGPAAIALMLYVNTQFDQWIRTVQVGQNLIAMAATIWHVAVVWAFMFFVYWLIPNTRVGVRPALAGALVTAILLIVGAHTLGLYFSRAFTFSFFYGTLGLIPVVMFWMYLMWLVVLFGLEVAATIQYVQTHSLRELEQMEDKRPQAGLVDPAAVLVVMELINERFAEGLPVTAREISDETRIPETVANQILTRLSQAAMVHFVDAEDRAVTLARPPEQICADRLIEIGYSMVDEGSRGRESSLVHRLREAQKRLAATTTLASLLGPRPAPPASDQVSRS
jgi:membrane protein